MRAKRRTRTNVEMVYYLRCFFCGRGRMRDEEEWRDDFLIETRDFADVVLFNDDDVVIVGQDPGNGIIGGLF